MSTETQFLDKWWQGIGLWYNAQAYEKAMTCWEDASRENVCDDKISNLLVFLAGCNLDARNFVKARECCLRALENRWDRPTAFLATGEYIASYEEDDTEHEPWKEALRIVKKAIKKGSNMWVNPYQRPGFLYHPIAPKQKHIYEEVEQPSWCRSLETNSNQILNDFKDLYKHGKSLAECPTHWPAVGSGSHRDGAGQHDGSVLVGDWREIVLFGSGGQPHLAPFTSRLLQQYAPDAIDLANAGGGEIIFSVLGPKARIQPHCAGHNLRLTAHLGLVIPSRNDRCQIRIADDWRDWEEGKVLVFDDSFEHEVRNDSNQIRAVLLLRFWHPSLRTSERHSALESVMKAKQEDGLRRCCPPLPVPNCWVEDRGMERTNCEKCTRTGHQSIRIQKPSEFLCVCGLSINQ